VYRTGVQSKVRRVTNIFKDENMAEKPHERDTAESKPPGLSISAYIWHGLGSHDALRSNYEHITNTGGPNGLRHCRK